jgi:hypothetical protein
MNTTRHPDSRGGEGSGPEKRAETVADGAFGGSDGAPLVTVVRPEGVVQPSSGRLIYEVDSSRHLVVARHGSGPVAFAFGGYGDGPGQFRTPLHVIAVPSVVTGDAGSGTDVVALGSAPWLAVADYGNHRIQFFECDGAYLGDTELGSTRPPCLLYWSAPVLSVTTLDGRTIRVRPAAALLSLSRRGRRDARWLSADSPRTWRVC